MDAKPVKIFEYFNGEKQSLIPLFQRPYSWWSKHWNALWGDLMQQYDPEERGSHFMGAVVSVPAVSRPVGVAKHLVIDGQQRLTTLSILLAAIRNKSENDGAIKLVNKINRYLTNPDEDAPDDLKLVPTQIDREAFKALVLNKPIESFEETKIIQGYYYFLEKLNSSDGDGNPVVAKEILDIICQSLEVVMINLAEHDDPYLIFESLNHKGEPLTQSDLVRNYVLMRFQHSTSSGGEQEEVYKTLWEPMENALDDSMSEFMRHYMMRLGKNVRKNEIYGSMKAVIAPLKNTGDVKETLHEMKKNALVYAKLLKPDTIGNSRIQSKIQALKELETTVFNPIILRLYSAMEQELINTDELIECLSMIESFYLRRSVCGVPTNALNKVCLEICSQFPKDNIKQQFYERLNHGGAGRRWPSDDEFRNGLINDKVYSRRKIVKFLLVQLEAAQGHKEPASINGATIEHLMPQTLSDEWKTDLGDNHNGIYEKWLDTVGNLTRTGYNSELGNLRFAEKKKQLENTHFEITRYVLSSDKWGAEEIKTRAEWLTNSALIRWPK